MKHLSSLIMMAALFVVSCQVKESDLTSIISEKGKEVIITASINDSPITKTEHIDYKKVYWSPQDEIVVFSAGEASKFTSLNDEPAKAAKFKGQISVVSGVNDDLEDSYIWGLYPYREDATLSESLITTVLPSNQVGAANTFADDLLITMGRSLNFSIPFYHVCSGLRFTLTKSGVQSVTLTANGGEPVAGRFKAGIGEDGKPFIDSVIDPSSSVTVVAPDNGVFEPGVWYYIITLPVTFSEGITFTMNTSEERGTKIIKSSFSLKQGNISTSTEMDKNVQYYANCATPELVDLGLSVKWASCNLGANNPEDFGYYYAWGEVAPKASYGWSNYRWGDGTSSSITKYCLDSSYGQVDGLSLLESKDDAACINLGEGWRMPTKEEWTELMNNCSWEWTTMNGINGYLISGKKSGFTENSIFLPAAGIWEESSFNPNNSSPWSVAGSYWSSNLGDSNIPYNLDFDSVCPHVDNNSDEYRYTGQSIRPVWADSSTGTRVELNKNELSLTIGAVIPLIATITPGAISEQDVTWSSSNPSVATVDQNGIVMAVSSGNTTVTASSSDGVSAECSVWVKNEYSEPEAVDLGLSVKWATFNLGATVPEDFGCYYAWGETSPKETYSWQTYKWCNGSQFSINKYSLEDKLYKLEAEDDAAYVNLGDHWRIPTSSEFNELLDADNCQWILSSVNGIEGYEVKSLINGNSIFLPFAGEISNAWAKNSGTYITSSLRTTGVDVPYVEWVLGINAVENRHYLDSWYRYAGYSIRPVWVDPISIAVTELSIDLSTLSLMVGTSKTLTATVLPENATNKIVTWTSSDESVATVDPNGNVTAVAMGTTTITATTEDGGFTATCEVTVKKPFPEGNAFDEDAFITYVANHQEWLSINTDKTYRYDTYFSADVSGTMVEMKFSVPGSYSGKAILTYGSSEGLAIDATNIYYYSDERHHEDGDTWYEREFTQGVESGVDGTGIVVLTASCNGNQVAATVNGKETTLPVSISSFATKYIFSDYDYQSGDGALFAYIAGIPDDAKLYYVKIWNGNNLVYFGHASRSVCPYSSEEEYCWYEEIGGTYTFARNLHTLTSSDVTPYNPTAPIATIRQPFGGGID